MNYNLLIQEGLLAPMKNFNISNKGYIIGSVSKSNTQFSTADRPVIHATKEDAIAEAARLIQSGSIASNRKAVVLKVEAFVELNQNPVIVS